MGGTATSYLDLYSGDTQDAITTSTHSFGTSANEITGIPITSGITYAAGKYITANPGAANAITHVVLYGFEETA